MQPDHLSVGMQCIYEKNWICQCFTLILASSFNPRSISSSSYSSCSSSSFSFYLDHALLPYPPLFHLFLFSSSSFDGLLPHPIRFVPFFLLSRSFPRASAFSSNFYICCYSYASSSPIQYSLHPFPTLTPLSFSSPILLLPPSSRLRYSSCSTENSFAFFPSLVVGAV